MTLLGKILVFINLLLSVLMLSFAFAIYTNHIDFSAAAPKGDKPAGLLAARQARVKAASEALNVAGDRWRDSLAGPASLPEWEKRIAADRAWYAAQLEETQSGPEGKLNVPIKAVKTGPDGLPILDPANGGRPTMVGAERRRSDKPDEAPKPLFCRKWYEQEMGRLSAAIDAEQVNYQEQVKEARELTQLASGPKPVGDKDIRDGVAPKYGLKPGDIPLRQRIIDEQTKLARITEEMKDVTGREKNADVEAEILQSRHDQLERRVEELKKEKK